MESEKFQNQVKDPQISKLLDNILDAVLALEARLVDSNMDTNSIGGILRPIKLKYFLMIKIAKIESRKPVIFY